MSHSAPSKPHPAIPVDFLPITALASPDMLAFIESMPKVELHVHLEGTLEAAMKFALAARNGIALPYADIAALERSYIFHDLPSFLAIYYEGNSVLLTEQDFYDLCYAYLAKAAAQNVQYSEMFFDPQQHLCRGVGMDAIIGGITRAQADARGRFGIESGLILCFMRELTVASAIDTLEAARPYYHHLIGVGLDSDERGNPPSKFITAFDLAREADLRVTVHCDIDQDDAARHIRQAIEDVRVDRIDHGGNILESRDLIELARVRGIAFTVCPSFSGMLIGAGDAPIDIVRHMLNTGLSVTVSTDDPAYMRGEYLTEVLVRAHARSKLSKEDLLQLQRNAINAAWIPRLRRQALHERLANFAAGSRTGAEPG